MIDRLKLFWEISRPRTLLPPALGMVTGGIISWGADPRWESSGTGLIPLTIGSILLGAVMAAVLNAASNTLNQITDIKNDAVNKPHRVLPSGRMTIKTACIFSILMWFLALALACCVGVECLLIVLVASVFIYNYSAPPLRLRAHPFNAPLAIAIPRGLLLFVAGWSTVKTIHNPEPWYLGLVFFLFILGASVSKDFSDMEGDRRAGCSSLPLKYGVKKAAIIISPFFIFPFLLIPLGVHWDILSGNSPLLWVLAFALAAWGTVTIFMIVKDPQSLAQGKNHPSWTQMYRMMMVLQAGLALSYLI